MIAFLSAAGLDGPITDAGWLQKNIDNGSAASWERLGGEIATASSSPSHRPFLYANAREEDVVVSTAFLATNPFSGIGFRFSADLTQGWVLTRSSLSWYDHGTVSTAAAFTAIPDGTVVTVKTGGPDIQVTAGLLVVNYSSAFAQHNTNHGVLQVWSDLSGRWGDISVDSLPTSLDVNSATPGTETQAGGSVFARQRPPGVITDRPQQGLQVVLGPVQLVEGRAVARPMLGASSESMAYPRSFDPTEFLADALSIGANGASSCWLPDTADVVVRGDLGSDVTVWNPHFGSDPGFEFHAATAPYVDPGYDYWASGKRRKTAAAMIFDGDHWAQSLLSGPDSAFSWILALVIHHPRDRTWNDVLASPSAITDPLAATDATLRYHNGRVQAFVKGKMSEADLHPPLYKARIRPAIIGWAQEETGGTLAVLTANGYHKQSYHHASAAPGFDMRFYLGVNGSAVDADHASEMDVLGIYYYPGRLSLAALRKRMNALDHVHGVSGR